MERFGPVVSVATKAATLELAPENHIPPIFCEMMLPPCDPTKRRGRCSNRCLPLGQDSVPTSSCPHKNCWRESGHGVSVLRTMFLGLVATRAATILLALVAGAIDKFFDIACDNLLENDVRRAVPE